MAKMYYSILKKKIIWVIEYIDRQPKQIAIVLGLLLVLSITYIRYATGPELAFSVFYLLPICMVTWFAGRKAGILISLLSSASWLMADTSMENAFSSYLIPYINQTLRLFVFIFITYIISALRKELESERALSRTDVLTGISNRRAFFELAEIEVSRAYRYSRPFTVIYLDLDNFKMVNDSYGHETGDKVLVLVSDIIKNNIRNIDIFSRLGGDEFVLFLPEIEKNSAKAIAQKLQSILLMEMNNNQWPVTFSIGVACFINNNYSLDEIINKADDLMYKVKSTGKKTIKLEVFD